MLNVPQVDESGARALLRAGLVAAPLLAGADKFFGRMVVWEEYLAPAVARRLPVKPAVFMRWVGAVEIGAGLLVAARPRVGAPVVAVWLTAIAAQLVLHPRRYLDIALRDVGLALGALALARLEQAHARELTAWPLPTPTREGAVPMPQRLRPGLEEPSPGPGTH